MKKRKKISPIGIFLFLLAGVCVVLTAILVAKMLTEEHKKESVNLPKADVQEKKNNVYILSASDGKITYLYENETYEAAGSLGMSYEGIADLQIKNDHIEKVYLKQSSIQGVLLRYTEEEMEISDFGLVKRGQEIPVYSVIGENVVQKTMGDLVVGCSRLTYVVANSCVEAILIEEPTRVEDIRVLIKNGTEEFYPSLHVRSGAAFTMMSGSVVEQKPENTVVDILEFMDRNSLSYVRMSGEKEELTVCDASGNPIGNSYPGTLYCWLVDGKLVLINELSIEEYVSRVLPSEMPANSSFEALKAQAVCARTYAYSQIHNAGYARYGANLDDTTAFQVYNKERPEESTNRAVAETEGLVLMAPEGLARCYYYSTSPGITENLEVWSEDGSGENGPSYLQKVCCTKNDPGDLSTESAAAGFLQSVPEGYDSKSPFYRWNATLNLGAKLDDQYGKVQSLAVRQRSSSGYVLRLDVMCEEGTRSITGENAIRKYLGGLMEQLILLDGTIRQGFSMIPSACFVIAADEEGSCVLRGGGFGHGIGFSQYGADAMGEAGKTYEEILKFYYIGVEIVSYENE